MHKRPVWNGCLSARMARDYERQASGNGLYARLSKAFDSPASARQVATKREAFRQVASGAAAFAAAVLSAPADYPAHVVDFALGLLNEATDAVNKDRRAKAWASG